MPKELFEIRAFDKGIGLSVDPKDLNQDAASYSLNVEPQSISGELSGIPQDIDVTGTSMSQPIASAIVYENSGVNTHRAVVYDASGEDVYEAAGIEESGTPTFTAATGGDNISSDGEPVFTPHAGKVYMGMGSSSTKYPYLYEYLDGRNISLSSLIWATYQNPTVSITDGPYQWSNENDEPWNVPQGYQVNKSFRNPGYPNPATEYPILTAPTADNLPAVFCKNVSAAAKGTYPALPAPAAGRYYLYYSIVYATGEESPLNELYSFNFTGSPIEHQEVTITSNQVIEINTLMIAFPYDPSVDRKFPDNAYSIRIYVGEAESGSPEKENSITIPRLGIEIVQSEITALSVIGSDTVVTGYSVTGTDPSGPSAGIDTYPIVVSGYPSGTVGTVEWNGSDWVNEKNISPIDTRYARGYTSLPTFKVFDGSVPGFAPATVTPTTQTSSFLAEGLYLVPRTGPNIDSCKITISTLGPTYDANTGFSYLRNFSIVHWNLATQVNGTHVVADVYNPELPEEALEWKRYLLKSQPYAYGTFDWANDFVILKDEPTALASYAGRVYAFGESWFQRINPDPLFVEDTYDGIGCMDKYAVLETEYGLFWASENSIYMLDGSGLKDIGEPIKISDGTPSSFGWSEVTKGRVRMGFDAKRNAVMVMSQGQNLAWVYSITKGRWDLWDIPANMWSVCNSPEGHSIIFAGTTYHHYLQDPTNKRAWEWTSGDLSMGEPSYEKFFGRIYFEGTGSATARYSLDGGSYSTPISGTTLLTQGTSGNKDIKIKLQGSANDTVSNIGISYRRKVK